jgi:hypothetical protein
MSVARRMAPLGATTRWHPLALVPLALTAWIYYPITRVFFFQDDFLHLSRITNGSDLTFVLEPFGGHNYLVRNLIFLCSWYLFGLHTELWYWTVLLTHLLNVWLLFGVVRTLTASAALACLGATIWGTCPLHVGTLAVYSVYGQVMAATILLVVLDGLTRLGAASAPLPARTAVAWYALLLAGTTCFGTGIGVALAFPLVLLLLLPAAWRQRGVRLAYLALPAVTLAAYFGLKRLYALFEPLPFAEAMHEYMAIHGLWAAPAMLAHLLGFAVAGSTLGYFFQPQHYPDALDWLTIAAFAIGLGLVAWRGDRERRRVALAMGALAVGVYTLIAVGRASLYQGFSASSAQAAAFLRYHYEGTIPIVVLLCLIFQQVGRIGWLSAIPRGVLLPLGLGVLAAGYLRSGFSIDEHPAARAYVTRTAAEIAAAVAAAPPGQTVYLENGSAPTSFVGMWLEMQFPGRAAVFLLLSPSDDSVDGRHIRFIERNQSVLESWHQRSSEPMARLLIAPEHAPACP